MNSLRPLAGLLAGLLPLAACATGGEEDRPVSQVTISASHRMYGLGGQRLITRFPIPKSAAGSELGVFSMNDQSEYTITRPGRSASPPQTYSLANDGELYVVVPVANSSPTRYVGAYRTGVKVAEVFYFTDRFAPTGNPVVGMYWGTRTTEPARNGDVQGRSFYLFTQHVVFSKSVFPDKNDIGRSVAGEIAVSAKDEVTGSGRESSGADLLFTGTAAGFANDSVDFSLDFKKGTASDVRKLQCGQTHDVILGVDEDSTGDKAGLVALVEKRDLVAGSPPSPLSEADARKLIAGTYHFGMHTIFVATGRSGIDAANGTLELNEQGGWKLTGVGSAGPQAGKFSYAGTYTFEVVGGKRTNRVVFSVNGPPKETWTGAVDAAYGILVVIDNEIESRGSESPELNMMLATRVAAAK